MPEQKATSHFSFDRPVSQPVQDAATKISEGIEAALNAMTAPDAEELFDVVLVSAAAFFSASGRVDKQMRWAILSRFEHCLRVQPEGTVKGDSH